MRVNKFTLKNFRNVADCSFYPDSKINFLVGLNGQGKTSFLEALGYLATLRSFRGSKSTEVIRWETNVAEIKCDVTSTHNSADDWNTELKILFYQVEDSDGKAQKVAFINGKVYRSSTKYLSQRFGNYELGFHTVIFNPSDHDIVRGEPAQRRAYFDRVLAAEDIEYLELLEKYRRVLEQRNAILRSREGGRQANELLVGFSEPLVSYGSLLTLKRLQWIKRAASHLNDASRKIAPDQPLLRLIYLSNWITSVDGLVLNNKHLTSVHLTGHEQIPSLETIENSFWNKLSSLEAVEWRSGYSIVGPHRDDWTFLLGNRVLKGHGSQGEIRSALLALKLSEIELFRNETGHRPLFLLDDFSSELDKNRREFLLSFLMETDLQVFITGTEDAAAFGKRYWVQNGILSPATT